MYHCPTELDDALQIASGFGGTIIAGGTDFYSTLRRGRMPAQFLDVTRIRGFSDIERTAEGYRIGAGANWSQIARADLPPAFDALKDAACEVGGIQIQNAGTIAGNICNASPAADGVPPLLALDASVELTSSARGRRTLPLSGFICGVRETALYEDELVTAVLVPPQPEETGSAFIKLGSRKYLVISIAMTAANITRDKAGRITDARLAVGACSSVAVRLHALEQHLLGKKPDQICVTSEHLTPLAPITDVRGTAAYRLDVVRSQCKRAIMAAVGHG